MVIPPFRAGDIQRKISRLKDGTSSRDVLPAASHGLNIGTILKRRLSGECRLPDGRTYRARPPP
ncbi:MAG: hypothetical protein K6G44_03705 [Lentisphaeria bacterium]|nr:hypothetical protein [Lentisphaeria bacterium]